MSESIDAVVMAHLAAGLRVQVRGGFDEPDDIVAGIAERVVDELGRRSPALVAALEEEVHRELAALAAERAAWSPHTLNDALTVAFTKLTRAGVIALEDAGFTLADGWSDIEEMTRDHPHARGAVFYHHQDLERAVQGEGLYLAFGSLPREHPDERSRSLAIGREVVAALTKHGVATEWDGTVKQRIRIPPFVWQRRLLPT